MVRCKGVTLIELMVTLSIAGVFLAIAIPSFVTFTQNSRRDSQVLDLVTSLNNARSEAIKRGVMVKVCSSTTGADCAGSTNWDSGWLAFADEDGDTNLDVGETIISVHGASPGAGAVRSVATRVTFRSSGYSRDNADVTLMICDSRGTAAARTVVVSPMGRVSTQNGAASCP